MEQKLLLQPLIWIKQLYKNYRRSYGWCKKSCKYGKNIIILMDSLTRLSRAYNIVLPSVVNFVSGELWILQYTTKFLEQQKYEMEGKLNNYSFSACWYVPNGWHNFEENLNQQGNCDIYLDKSFGRNEDISTIDVKRSRSIKKEELLLDSTILNMI